MAELNAMINCPSCNTVGNRPKTLRAGLDIYECDNCSLNYALTSDTDVIHTDPDFYHSIDISYDKQLEAAREILPTRIEAYEKLIGRKMKSVLEIGCATGAYARAYDELGIDYTAVEIETDVATKAAKRTGLNIINADFLDQTFANNFDIFFCSQVLEHVPNPTAFIKHAGTMVPNGLIHLDVPNHDGLTSSIRKVHHHRDYGFIQPPHHMIAYNKKSLMDLFKRCNLDIIHCQALANNHKIWGQLLLPPSFYAKIIYRTASMINRGSLLSILAKA